MNAMCLLPGAPGGSGAWCAAAAASAARARAPGARFRASSARSWTPPPPSGCRLQPGGHTLHRRI